MIAAVGEVKKKGKGSVCVRGELELSKKSKECVKRPIKRRRKK